MKNYGTLVGTFHGMDIYIDPTIHKDTVVILKQKASDPITAEAIQEIRENSIKTRLWKLANPEITYKKG